MKVLFLSHYPYLYGANRSLLNLIKELKKFGVESYVLTPLKGDLTNELDKINITYILSDLEWSFLEKNDLEGLNSLTIRCEVAFREYKNAKRLANSLKQHNFDLIYTNSSVLSVGYFIARKLKLPHIWHIREFGELDYNFAPAFGYKIFKYILRKSSASIFVSNCLRRYYNLEKDSKSHVIYNGVVSEDFSLKFRKRKVTSIDKQTTNFVFCIVGVVGFQKNQIEAIKGFELLRKKYYNIKLTVAGGGDRKALEEYVDNNNINNVEFLGHVDDPFSVFLSSDASLMCSKNEAMGRVTVESMCLGVPVIGLDSAGTKELIQHNETGLLYKGSVEDLAAQMERLIVDAELRNKLANNGWEWAYKRCTQEVYGKKVFDIISATVKKENLVKS